MSKKERERKVMMEAVRQGRFSLMEASERMEVSYRQAKRIWKRYQESGDRGLLHQNRGVRSSYSMPNEFKTKVLSRYQERYLDFGPTFACEKLKEDGFCLSDETLRLWLKSAGLSYPKRKRKGHRKQRERREGFGELIQIDGSIHRWFRGQDKKDCLLDMVDDATGTSLALLAHGETTQVLLSALMLWIKCYGIPKEVYVDLKTVYISPKPEGFSVFQEVCQRLGIEVNKAYSAQAKGRVERKHAIYQDRFVKELTLRKIDTIKAANEYLLKEFIPLINKKFALPWEDKPNKHRRVDSYGDLNQIICWHFERQVQNDWTIQWKNKHYQILKDNQYDVRPKQKVELRLHLDGELSIWRGEKKLRYEAISTPIKVTSPVVKKYSPPNFLAFSLAGKKGRARSPWGQFNPNWLKGSRVTDTEYDSLKSN